MEQIALELSKIYQDALITEEVSNKQSYLLEQIKEQAKNGDEFDALYLIVRQDRHLTKYRYDYIQKAAETGHLMSFTKIIGAHLQDILDHWRTQSGGV